MCFPTNFVGISQRWGIVKKRQRKSGPGEGDKGTQSVKKEALLAAHQAITHFLDSGSNRTPITVGTGDSLVHSCFFILLLFIPLSNSLKISR